jgi:hypothetical protein
MYFSFVTLSTIGYGDIIPVNHVARMLAIIEATSGLLYMAMLVARLVALYSREPSGSIDRPESLTDADKQGGH